VNLGNTCYLDASLQCLTNIEQLVTYFTTRKYKSHICPDWRGKQGVFADNFYQFIQRHRTAPGGPNARAWAPVAFRTYFGEVQ
jgi:ubiquitin C-terminal hydrolase